MNGRHRATTYDSRLPMYFDKIARLNAFRPIEGANVLEVGTGWEPLSPLLFYLFGAKHITTFDHERHARFESTQPLVTWLSSQTEILASKVNQPKALLDERLRPLLAAQSLEELFSLAHITYVAPGDAAHSELPANSVDIVYSYAVLEHVPPSVAVGITEEARRVLMPEGIAYHAIGLHDHYSGFDPHVSKVNFLQYPERSWDLFVKNSISYHNRLRERQFLDIFEEHRATILDVTHQIDPDDVERLKTMKVDKQFETMTPEELAVTYTEVIMTFS
jgi:hypothetical protein